MRFMLLMIPKGYESAPPGIDLDVERVKEMMRYNESLQEAGILRSLEGLHPPSSGARVTFNNGEALATDGPFAEAKEVLGGFWIIEVANRDEAIAWAKRVPGSDNEIVEVRQIQEMDDYTPEVQEAASGFAEMRSNAG